MLDIMSIWKFARCQHPSGTQRHCETLDTTRRQYKHTCVCEREEKKELEKNAYNKSQIIVDHSRVGQLQKLHAT